MADTITKIDENSIKVVKEITQTTENNYSYGDLIKQKEAIEAQKAREIEQRDIEIAEVSELIKQAELLGIKA